MIGLFTPYKISNYGTKLQAYAVQQVMGRFGDVEVIDYEPSLASRMLHKPESMRNMRYLDQMPNQSFEGLNPMLVKRRNDAIGSFDQLLATSKPLVGKHALTRYTVVHYNAVVCGSDQIWNPVNLARHVFMLEFVPRGIRRVAFSPSFGLQSLPTSLKATYKRRLSHIDCFSVREESGVRILKDLGYGNATWTLDPTLVLDRESWEKLATPPAGFQNKESSPYLFCYFLGNRKEERDIAREVACAKGLRVVTLPHFKGHVPCDDGFGDEQLFDVTPQNFVWLIQNAAAICTDSFHGCAFSIQFERELFYVRRHAASDTGATNDRVVSLLRDFGLEARVVPSISDMPSVALSPVDFQAVRQKLSKRRDATLDYLARSLEGIQ